MTLFLAAAAALLILWLFSRAAVFVIERRWPPLGQAVEVDGLRIQVLDLQMGPLRPPLLLLHGASGNMREPLAALGEKLAGPFRIVAIDRPGHGHSSRGDRKMSDPERQADLVAHVMDELAIPAAIVLGHSWSAAVALALAAKHSDRVEGLVLMAPASHPWPGGVSVRTRFFAAPLIGGILAEFIVVPIGLAIAGRVIRAIFEPVAVPQNYARRIGALLAVRPKTFVANCRDIVDFYGHIVRISARYPEIRAPVEILTGDTDRVLSPAIHAFALARDVPGARLTILAGAGHMPHWSRTEDVAAAIARVAERSAELWIGEKSRRA